MASPSIQPDLIIYGGAFDPPHQGHAEALAEAHLRFPAAAIHIIPGVKPAGAAGSHKSPASSFEERIKMCELAFAETLRDSSVVIDTIEAELPAPNLTVNTLEQIQKRQQPEQLSLLIGEDQLNSFPNWHEPKKILSIANLIVIARQSNADQKSRASLKELADRCMSLLELDISWKSDDWGQISNGGGHIFKLDKTINPAESRLIRRSVGAQQETPEGWLNPAVAAFINDQKLYQNQ